MTARTASSSAACSMDETKPAIISTSIALRRSGRFSVIVATPSSASYSTASLVTAPF